MTDGEILLHFSLRPFLINFYAKPVMPHGGATQFNYKLRKQPMKRLLPFLPWNGAEGLGRQRAQANQRCGVDLRRLDGEDSGVRGSGFDVLDLSVTK